MARILLVDDDAELLQVLSAALEIAGHSVTQARTGGEALAKVTDLEHDLVILDLYLTDFGGFHILGRVSELPESVTPKVLIITGDEEKRDQLEAMELPYLFKPLEHRHLLEQVEALVPSAPDGAAHLEGTAPIEVASPSEPAPAPPAPVDRCRLGRVKGLLFVEYVRMIRSRPDENWRMHLRPGDFEYLDGQVDEGAWYPMDVFERLGLAVRRVIGHDQLEPAWVWGRLTAAHVAEHDPEVVVQGDPVGSLMRILVIRNGLFDYNPVHCKEISPGGATLLVNYGMSGLAEEAATHQVMGFFERLVELTGEENVAVGLEAACWDGAEHSRVVVAWG